MKYMANKNTHSLTGSKCFCQTSKCVTTQCFHSWNGFTCNDSCSLARSIRTGTLHTTGIKIMIKGYTLPKMKADPSSAPCYKLYPRQMEGQATPLHYSARPGELLLWMLSGILEKMYLWSLYNIMWIWQSQRETRQRPCFAARAYRSEFMRMDIEAYVHTHIHRHTHWSRS